MFGELRAVCGLGFSKVLDYKPFLGFPDLGFRVQGLGK